MEVSLISFSTAIFLGIESSSTIIAKWTLLICILHCIMLLFFQNILHRLINQVIHVIAYPPNSHERLSGAVFNYVEFEVKSDSTISIV